MKRYLFALLLSSSFFAHNIAAQEQQCGSIEMASLGWQSAELLTYVNAYILKHGLGCKVSIVIGDTIPTAVSMVERQQPDVAPEFNPNAALAIAGPALAEGRIIGIGNPITDGVVEFWWMPKFILDEHPEIKTVADVLKRPDLFPAPENPDRGAVLVGPEGWSGSVVTQQFYKAFGFAEAGFDLVHTGSAAGLEAAIAAAYERKKGFISYYWTPTALLAKYPMVRLPTGTAHDAEEWSRCTIVVSCPDPKPNEFAGSTPSVTLVTKKFAERPDTVEARAYFEKQSWTGQEVGVMLLWMQENQATGKQGALHFLKNYPEIWKRWVSEDMAAKIEATL